MTATLKPAARRRQQIAVSAPVTYSRAPSAVDHLDTAEVLEQLPTLANWPSVTGAATMWRGGAQRILQWLSTFDGNGWQERWEAARGDDLGWVNDLVAADCPPRGPVRSRDELLRGLRALLYLRAIRPSYVFFLNYHPSSLYDLAREVIEPAAFNRCYETGKALGFSGGRLNDGMRTIVRMVLHTGGRSRTSARPISWRCATSTAGPVVHSSAQRRRGTSWERSAF